MTINKVKSMLLAVPVLVLASCGSALRAEEPPPETATVTISGINGSNSATEKGGDVTVAFNGFSETLTVAPDASSTSIASDLAVMFSNDFSGLGLTATVGEQGSGKANVITFQLPGGSHFSAIRTSSPGIVVVTPNGFRPSTNIPSDSGTITLYVNNYPVSSTNYGVGSTAESVANDLASTPASSPVALTASGASLYITSKQTGGATNYPYFFTVENDLTDYPTPSFQPTPASGALAGGADIGTGAGGGGIHPVGPTLYSYSITNPADGTSGYDAAGNVKFMTDSVMGQWSYQYDDLNELSLGQASTGPYASNSSNLCWGYDGFGNRTHSDSSANPFTGPIGESCAQGHSGTHARIGTNNQIEALQTVGNPQPVIFGYDGAGDLTDDGVNTYLYDAENRLCAVHGVTGMTGYQYDAEGTRVSKGTITSMSCDLTVNGYQATNDYILDQGNAQMTEMVNENGRMIWLHTNVKADGMLIGTYDLAGLHFYLNDALGSRRVQTDGGGVLEQSCQSLPFGDQLNCTMSLSAPTEHHFTGKERDAESGLDYFGARYYASNMGRWMNPDWADKPEAVPYSSLDDPQSLNLYGYVRNNPLGRADPDGHCCFSDYAKGALQGTEHFVSSTVQGAFLIESVRQGDPEATLTLFRGIANTAGDAAYVARHAGEIASSLPAGWAATSAQGKASIITEFSEGAALTLLGGSEAEGGAAGVGEDAESVAGPVEAYNRRAHYGNTPTPADRRIIGGESVDHDPPLVQRYYEGDPSNGEKPGYRQTAAERKASATDRTRMRPSTKSAQRAQGGKMARYSKQMKKDHKLK